MAYLKNYITNKLIIARSHKNHLFFTHTVDQSRRTTEGARMALQSNLGESVISDLTLSVVPFHRPPVNEGTYLTSLG